MLELSLIVTCVMKQPVQKDLEVIPNDQALVYAVAMERIKWHDKLQGPEAVQKRVHEYVHVF